MVIQFFLKDLHQLFLFPESLLQFPDPLVLVVLLQNVPGLETEAVKISLVLHLTIGQPYTPYLLPALERFPLLPLSLRGFTGEEAREEGLDWSAWLNSTTLAWLSLQT